MTSSAPISANMSKAQKFATLTTALKEHLYRVHRLSVWKCKSPKQTSQTNESEGDFRSRLGHTLREQRDLNVEKLRQKYAPKVAALQEQVRKAEQRKAKEAEQAKSQGWSTMLSVGSSLLGAFLGKKALTATNISKARFATLADSLNRTPAEIARRVGRMTCQEHGEMKVFADELMQAVSDWRSRTGA